MPGLGAVLFCVNGNAAVASAAPVPTRAVPVVLRSAVLKTEKILWLPRVQVAFRESGTPSPYHKPRLLLHSVQPLAEAAPDSTRGWWERRVEGGKPPATLRETAVEAYP